MAQIDFFQALNTAAPQIPTIIAAVLTAVLGYLIGRRERKASRDLASHGLRELQRASQVAEELESIAEAIRKDLTRHRASVNKFKQSVSGLSATVNPETWQHLCKEAEEILLPTQRLAGQIANSYDALRQQVDHLKGFTEVRTDPLTGIRNRRAMEESLETLLAMKHRYDHAFSIVLFDIDFFKAINDKQGHLMGDRVLRAVADLLAEGARDCDIVARYGGEEFVLLQPQTGLNDATVVAERLRQMIEDSVLENVKLTVSGGVATYQDGDDLRTIVGRADRALYQAKAQGRNRIVQHTGSDLVSAEFIRNLADPGSSWHGPPVPTDAESMEDTVVLPSQDAAPTAPAQSVTPTVPAQSVSPTETSPGA